MSTDSPTPFDNPSGNLQAPRKGFRANTPSELSGISEKSPLRANNSDNSDIPDRGFSEFPLDALPPALREIVEETSRTTLAPPCLPAAAGLAVTSTALGAGLELKSGAGRTVRGNLFLLAIAQTGVGKSVAARPLLEPLATRQAGDLARWKKARHGLQADLRLAEKAEKAALKDELRDELEKAMRDKAEAEEAMRREPLIYCTDTTRERLPVDLADAPREALGVLSTEARGLVGILRGRYSNNGGQGDEDAFLAGYSGDAVNVRRGSRDPVALRRPCLSAFVAIQPDLGESMLADKSLVEGGLLARFLAFDAKAEPQLPPEQADLIDSKVASRYEKLISGLLDEYRKPMDGEPGFQTEREEAPVRTVSPTKEAAEILREFEAEAVERRSTGGDLHDVAGFVARWAENCYRLALILHVGKLGRTAHDPPLDEDTATNAVRLSRWFAARQLELLAHAREESRRRRLARVLDILADHEGERTLALLRDSHNVPTAEVETLVKEFPNKLEIETRKPEGAGRPSRVLVVKPREGGNQ